MDASADQRGDAISQAADWTLRLEADPSDEGLRREFEQWLEQSEAHRTAYRKVQYTSRAIDIGRRDQEVSDNVVALKAPARRTRTRWYAAGAALAAACLALVLFPVLQKHMLADYVTGTAELRDVVLPDGSVASLDAGSAIAVNFQPDRREIVLLSGQAFFEVVPNTDRPFRVDADNVSVVVTGTAFGVNKTAQSVSVAVQSGTVEVALAGREPGSRLTVGQSWTYNREARTAKRGEVEASNVASWRSRVLVIHEARFDETLEEIGRHMPGTIVVGDGALNQQMVSGVYNLARPAEALEALVGSQRARITQVTPFFAFISGR